MFCVTGLFRLVALYHRWKIESLYVVSLSDQSEEIALPAIYLKKKINLSFALSRAIQGAKSLLLVCLSIGVILGLFLCVREDVNNRLGKNFHKGVFSFSVYAAKLREKDVATFGDFRLTRRSVGFSREQVEELKNMPGVKSVGVEYYGASPSLLIKDMSSVYARTLYQKDAKEERTAFAPALPEGIWATTWDMGNFRLYVLNQRQIYSMENYYPDVLADDLTLGKAVIITAPVKPEDERATYQNELFREGGEISFGWLATEAGFEEAVADPSLIGYEQVDFTISEVIEEAGDTPTKWAMGMRAANVIVIISEETAKSTGLCDWASSVKVTMNVSVTEKQYNAVKTRFREMKEESFGVMQSVPKTAEYDTSVLETVGLVRKASSWACCPRSCSTPCSPCSTARLPGTGGASASFGRRGIEKRRCSAPSCWNFCSTGLSSA